MDEAISASVLIMGCKMTYYLSVGVRNAPSNERHDITRFWTSVDAVDLFTAVAGVCGIFSSCMWFSVWVKCDPVGHVKVFDSETGFDCSRISVLLEK